MTNGTKVRITTWNGGDIVGVLYSDYRPTFEIILTIDGGREILISPDRLKNIQPA